MLICVELKVCVPQKAEEREGFIVSGISHSALFSRSLTFSQNFPDF